MRKHYNIKISGLVQGVGFRFSVEKMAESLKLSGFVKNDPDAKVYIEVEGEEKDLFEFLKWCKTGPSWAKVDWVETNEGDIKNFIDFKIEQ